MLIHQSIVGDLGVGLLVAGTIHLLLTLIATLVWRAARRAPDVTRELPPITVLKPLCGAEVGLYENLRSFFVQHDQRHQMVFGVQDDADPALEVVERLKREFPATDVSVVISPRQHGGNRKVSNLINMIAHARHDVLVMSDSDARVGPDYLESVTAPLRDPSVGLVTCIYRDSPTRGLWSRLGAMYINDWYIPSVLLAWLFGHRGFVSGQTICMRKESLQKIGGLPSLADHLADDYVLGDLIRKAGQRVVLSDYLPEVARHEPTFKALIDHEVRWMRTIMVLQPWGFRFLFMSFSLPLAVLGALLTASMAKGLAVALLLGVVSLRVMLHAMGPRARKTATLADTWLIPVRDCLLFYSWYKSLRVSRVSWRGAEFRVGTDGIMRASHEVQ